MHRSPPNPSDKSRLIYTFHMIEGGAGHEYDEKNWYVRLSLTVGELRLIVRLQPTKKMPFASLL